MVSSLASSGPAVVSIALTSSRYAVSISPSALSSRRAAAIAAVSDLAWSGSALRAAASSLGECRNSPVIVAPAWAAAASRRLRVGPTGLRSAARSNAVTAPVASPRRTSWSQRAQAGPPPPHRPGRRGRQVPGLPFGLVCQLGRQQPVGLTPVAAGGQLDDRGPGEGWRNTSRPVRSSTCTSPACSAGARQSIASGPATASRTRMSPVPSSAASSNNWRVRAGSPETLDANSAWRRLVSGKTAGNSRPRYAARR